MAKTAEEWAVEAVRVWRHDAVTTFMSTVMNVIAAAQAEARAEAFEEAAMVAIRHRWGMWHEPGEIIARDIRYLAASKAAP